MSIPGEVWGALAVVIAALLTFYGGRFATNQTAKAQERTAILESKAIDAKAYERARESYDAAITQYLREIDRLHERINALSARISQLNADIYTMEEHSRKQRREVESTMDQLIEVRAEYEKHLRWCNHRVAAMRERLKELGVEEDLLP